MNKLFTIILVFLPILSWSQFKVSGIVYAKTDNLGIPAKIIEKDTKNETIANSNGQFELTVKNENAILIVNFVGFYPKEVKINGKTKLSIEVKEDCNIDWFDYDQIGFELLSGLINTPIGGQVNFSFTPGKVLPLFKTHFSFQSNFKNNNFLNGDIGLYHLFVSCNFNADINLNYKNLEYMERLNLSTTSISTNLNLNKLGIIAGFGSLHDHTQKSISYGPTVGFRTLASRPLWLNITAKSTFNKRFIETNIEAKRPFKLFNTFVRFYSIKGFNELTLGIGKEISYHQKK